MDELLKMDGYDWLICPHCGNNDRESLSISVRPESVGFWCEQCDESDYIDI